MPRKLDSLFAYKIGGKSGLSAVTNHMSVVDMEITLESDFSLTKTLAM